MDISPQFQAALDSEKARLQGALATLEGFGTGTDNAASGTRKTRTRRNNVTRRRRTKTVQPATPQRRATDRRNTATRANNVDSPLRKRHLRYLKAIAKLNSKQRAEVNRVNQANGKVAAIKFAKSLRTPRAVATENVTATA